MTRFLVVGGRGFIGRRVLESLGSTDPVVGTTRRYLEGLQHVEAADPADLHDALDRVRPDVVVNAAGLLAGTYDELWTANVTLVRRLVDEVGERGLRLIHTGSAAEVGDPGTDRPIDESVACHPLSDYGRSKLAGTQVVIDAQHRGLDAAVARVFNTVGPAQHPVQPLGDAIRRIRDLDPQGGALSVGNCQVVRDFVEVGFVADAIAALGHAPRLAPVVNVCSGTGRPVQELIEALLAARGTTAQITDLGEPAIPAVVGDPTLLGELTGLRATTSVSQLARATLGAAPASGPG